MALVAFASKSRKELSFGKINPGINFYSGTWAQTLAKASSEKKMIFLDIYASWCGPCKRLKSTTFTDKKVADYYNENFINVTFDGEVGEGLVLARKYSLTAYPTLLFIDSTGEIVLSTEGYYSPDGFLKLGEKASK